MIDVAAELRRRFDFAAYWYLEAMEFRPDFELTEQEERMVRLFESLRDSVDGIPAAVLRSSEKLAADVGAEKFDALLGESIVAAGRKSFPRNATEFLETMNLSREALETDQ